MKTMPKLTALLTAVFAFPAVAHNVWLEKTANGTEYVVKFGHKETETYAEHKLTKVTAALKDDRQQPLKTVFNNGEAYINLPTDTDLVLIDFNNGTWCKMPNGKYVEGSKTNTTNAVTCLAAQKIGKSVIKVDDNLLKSRYERYELIPQSLPEAGKPLAILALKNGKPVQGIGVGEGEDAPLQQTNEQGIAYYTPKAGLNKVWAEFTEDTPNNPDYHSVSIEYLLTFELK
ncbi:DUF4198 domain-containing protein [Actinobacillus porcinus]|uniref:DUF4198 domain-containing protein n=1 Tax=Actinobacillus porcinus TaxID=51048 RepID=UPI00235527EB|nr:hypothetical protein [Actinobacillus porcinus]